MFYGVLRVNKKNQLNIVDILMDIIPGLRGNSFSKDHMSVMYEIWKNQENILDNKRIKKSSFTNNDKIKNLISNGYIEDAGSFYRVTNKGSDAIKKMILSNEKSTFENGMKRTAQLNSFLNDNWYSLYKNKWLKK